MRRLVFITLPHASLSLFTSAQGLEESKYLFAKWAKSIIDFSAFLKSHFERSSLYSLNVDPIFSMTSADSSDGAAAGIVPKFFWVKLRHLW